MLAFILHVSYRRRKHLHTSGHWAATTSKTLMSHARFEYCGYNFMLELITPYMSLLVALALGALVGWERERQGQWAGLRTHMIVSMTAALFMRVGYSSKIEVGHVIEGIITGIGFIGAGTILKLTDKQEVKGLTTAGTIWLSAGIGMASGAEQYSLALLAAILSLTVMILGKRIELAHSEKDSSKEEHQREDESLDSSDQSRTRH